MGEDTQVGHLENELRRTQKCIRDLEASRLGWRLTVCILGVACVIPWIFLTMLAGDLNTEQERVEAANKSRETCEASLRLFVSLPVLLAKCEEAKSVAEGDFALCNDELNAKSDVECPPAPECPESRPVLDVGELYDQGVEQARRTIAPLQEEYAAKRAELEPAIERAKALGVGPRIRDWISNPEAVHAYIEAVVRVRELDAISGRVTSIVGSVRQRLSRAWWTSVQNRRLEELEPWDRWLEGHERYLHEASEWSNWGSWVCRQAVIELRRDQESE